MGHIIGAVLADTQEHSRRAAKAVKIKYEELKPIVTIQVRWFSSASTVGLGAPDVSFCSHTCGYLTPHFVCACGCNRIWIEGIFCGFKYKEGTSLVPY